MPVKFTGYFIVLFLLVPFLCFGEPDTAVLVPAQSPAVLTLNLNTLLSKSDNKLPGAIARAFGEESLIILESPKNYGLNTQIPIRFFIPWYDLKAYTNNIFSSKDGDYVPWFSIAGAAALSDAGQFKNALLKRLPQETRVKRIPEFEYIIDQGICLAWTRDTLVFFTGDKMEDAQLLQETTALFNSPKEKSLASHKDYTAFNNQDQDLNFWLDLTHLKSNLSALPPIFKAWFFYMNALDDGFLGIGITFLPGTIKITFDDFKQDVPVIGKNDYRPVDDRILDQVPGKDLILLLTSAIRSERVISAIKKELDTLPPQDIKEIEGLFLAPEDGGLLELLSSIKGDLVLSLGNVDIKKNTFDIFGALSLNSPALIKKALAHLVKKEALSEKKNGNQVFYSTELGSVEVNLFIKGDTLYAATNALAGDIAAGKKPSARLPAPVINQIKAHHFYSLMELGPFFDSFPAEESPDPMEKALVQILRKVEITSDMVSEKQGHCLITITSLDKKQNTLLTLIKGLLDEGND